MKLLFQRYGKTRMHRPADTSEVQRAMQVHAPALASDLPDNLLTCVRELQKLIPLEPLLLRTLKALCSNASETDKYNAAEELAGAIYPKFKFSEYGRLFLEDEAFLDYYRRFMDPGNWHSLDRKYTQNQLLQFARRIDGDMAECGVYKGMSAYLICQALQGTGKLAHLFDSFEGLSAPGTRDGDYWITGALSAPEGMLRQTLAGFDNYRVYRGWIPQRFTEVAERKFSFVHIDVDLYQPTRDSLEFFYPRVSKGGVILMDDYGFITCPGAKLAADEFFSGKPECVMMLTTGQALVIKQ
jgi:O-methyltransferase